jgi:DNA-binding response OmpR family regulator
MTTLENDKHPTILIIEDNLALRGLFKETLQDDGFSVYVASDGIEGLNRFEDTLPDIILLDLIMPHMDGWETLERIRRVSECPVIIVTGQGTTEDIIKGLLEAGADDYLVKPFGLDELTARIRVLIKRSTLVR